MSYVFDELKENNQFHLLFTDELSKVSDEWRLCILATTRATALQQQQQWFLLFIGCSSWLFHTVDTCGD